MLSSSYSEAELKIDFSSSTRGGCFVREDVASYHFAIWRPRQCRTTVSNIHLGLVSLLVLRHKHGGFRGEGKGDASDGSACCSSRSGDRENCGK